MEGWKDLWAMKKGANDDDHDDDAKDAVQCVMEGCSHYCHLEAGERYGALVDSFCSRHEQ